MSSFSINNFFHRERKCTFRPTKKGLHQHGSTRYELHKCAKATLGRGDMKVAVSVPRHGQLHEWLATNTLDFFREISLIYETVCPSCTAEECPVMGAGSEVEYLWKDEKAKTPVRKPAPEYIRLLLQWVEAQLTNESIFPVAENEYPRAFMSILRNIYRKLFRVYAHVYYSHFDHMITIGAEAHLNSCFKHFVTFVTEYSLIEEREMAPLKDLIQNFLPSSSKR